MHERSLMDDERMVQTNITVPRRVWSILRALAERGALERGGRPNASRVVAELLEREAARIAEAEQAPRD